MKIYRFFLCVLMLSSFIMFSCEQSSEKEDVMPTVSSWSEHIGITYTGEFDGDFIMVELLKAEGSDRVKGVCLLPENRAVAILDTFNLTTKKDGVWLLESDRFSGKLEYTGLVERDTINITISIPRKFLGLFKIGTKSYDLEMYPFKDVSIPVYNDLYRKNIFDKVQIERDVEYGVADGYWTSFLAGDMNYWEILGKGLRETFYTEHLPLTLDLYIPENCNLEQRALIVLVHGGGFYVGDKAEPTYTSLIDWFWRKGYVVASVNYRMGFKLSAKSVERSGYSALQDVHAALRFLAHNSDKYGFNPNEIFLAGSSAGAITALNVAFMNDDEKPESCNAGLFLKDMGGINDSGNTLTDPFTVKAVVNMWGAVGDTNIIDDNEKVALLSFYGDIDQIVPFACGRPFQNVGGKVNEWIMPEMCGGEVITCIAQRKGWTAESVVFNGFGHMPHMNEDKSFNANFDTIKRVTTTFLADQLMDEVIELRGPQICNANDRTAIYSVEAESVASVNWAVDGGFIRLHKGNKVDVVWYSNYNDHIIYATAIGASGISSKMMMNVDVQQ